MIEEGLETDCLNVEDTRVALCFTQIKNVSVCSISGICFATVSFVCMAVFLVLNSYCRASDSSSSGEQPWKSMQQSPPALERVKVLPVFFVSKGESPPTSEQIDKLMRHLKWAQTRYLELLRNEDTFEIAEEGPKIYPAQHPLAFYQSAPEGSASQFVSELLADLKYNRRTCPYVFLIIVMNPHGGFSNCGGRPLNGNFNEGGGVVEMSSTWLNEPGFQGTLQHELGHSFGLAHSDAYGYDMGKCDSFMSYNPAHYTNGFTPSKTPGKLIPEDLRALALNKRVFPKYRFDPAQDVPAGYSMKAMVPFDPMDISGQDPYTPFDGQLAGKVPLLIKVRLESEGNREGRQLEWVGSKGKGLRMLGFSVSVQGKVSGIQLQYMAHISGTDDTPWVDAGTFLPKEEPGHGAGPADGQSGGDQKTRIEGIAFRVSGGAGEKYDVWYQAHVQNVGDTRWFRNGEFCGTRGQALRLEAFVVAVVPK